MIGLVLFLLWQADPGRLRFEQANQFAQQGRCEQAEPIYIELSQQYPNKAALPFALGQCQFHDKNYLAAAASFELALKIDPAAAVAASMRGAALGMAGQTAEALDQLRAAAKQDPSLASTFRMLGMFEVESGNAGPEALAALKQAVSLDASDDRAYYWSGEALLANKEYDAAVKQFEAALLLQPHSSQAMLGHAAALRATGQVQRAFSEFDAMLQQDPLSSKALLGAARCEYDLQHFPEATRLAEKVLRQDIGLEDRRSTLWLLARLYRLQNQSENAQRMETELIAIERDTNAKLARFKLLQEEAAAYRKAGNFAKVATALEEALKIEQRQDSLVVLGDAYRQLGRRNEAVSCYLRALQVNPDQPEIYERLQRTRAELASQTH